VIFEVANRLIKRNYAVQITALGGDHRWFPLDVPVSYAAVPPVFRLLEPYFRIRWRHSVRYDNVQRLINKTRLNFKIDFTDPLIAALPDCDVNIATWYPTAVPTWLSHKGRPIYLMQDYYEQTDAEYERRAFQTTLRLPMPFIVDSTYLKELVLKEQPSAKVKVATLGVNATTFNIQHKKTKRSGLPTISAILRGGYSKGNDILVNCLNAINSVFPIHASLVTNDHILEAFKPSIKFPYTPYIGVDDSSLADIYSSSDLFLFTSRIEGFGLPPLEAMACGTSVVTADCKGNRDYAINNYNCIMCDPEDVQSIKEAVILLLKNDAIRKQLIAGGLETAKHFTWDKTVDAYEAAIKESFQ